MGYITSSTVETSVTQLLGVIGSSGSFESFAGAAAVANNITGGTFSPPINTVTQLDATQTAALKTLTFNAPSAAQVQAAQTITLVSIQAVAAASQILISNGGKLNADSVTVPTNGALTVALEAGTSSSAPSIATFSSLSLSGPLNIIGGTNTVLQFPLAASNVSVATGASVTLKGAGVALRGNAAGAILNIQRATSDVTASAKVEASYTFAASASILNSAANLVVAGTIQFTGSRLEPRLDVQTGGVVEVAAPSGSTQLLGGNINLSAGTLQINGTSASSGSNVIFNELQSCSSSATITYRVSGTGRAAALSSGLTIMKYSARTSTQTSTFTCNVRVCDDLGCTIAVNSNVASGTSRRLLETQETATFESTGLTVKVSEKSTATMTSMSTFIMAIVAVMAIALQRLL